MFNSVSCDEEVLHCKLANGCISKAFILAFLNCENVESSYTKVYSWTENLLVTFEGQILSSGR